MSSSFHRVVAIVRADFLIRFRRASTLVVFLLLSAVPYLWIPDPATGRALMQSEGRRALYDSAAIGMATATLASLFIGLFGFYVISNALKRDIVSRCGFVIASTRVGGTEYLFGKLAGNVAFLLTFVAGFMATSMAMLLVRGEAPLEPWIFAKQYLLLVPPSIVLVSVMAIVFESIPFLSGKIGDVAWFFLWIASLGVVASQTESGSSVGLLHLFDFSGFAMLFTQTRELLGTSNISIGASDFDAAKGTFRFPGLSAGNGWGLWRLGAALTPLPFLAVARFFFHRFDPARLKVKAKGGGGWIDRFNRWLKPITRFVHALAQGNGRGSSVVSAARADALLTFSNFPLLSVAIGGLAIAALATNASELAGGILPVTFAVVAIAVSDVATRDRRSGTLAFVYATPALRERYVLWKFASILLFCVAAAAVPLVKLALAAPAQGFAAFIGLLFVAAAATALGIVSSNPKTFIVLFLTLWYIAMNEKTPNSWSDFGAFHGRSDPSLTIGYAVVAFMLLAGAQLWHRRQLAQ